MSFDAASTFGPVRQSISDQEVHVWTIALDPPEAVVGRLEPILSPDERGRAARFRLSRHRTSFIVSHGALRTILARYVGIEPGRLVFDTGPHGKPTLNDLPDALPLAFNLAHSHGFAVLAVTLARQVGIDIELVRPSVETDKIIGRYFCEQERAEFLGLPEHQRIEAFFRGWTCKEAYMKAIGLGFAMPLDQFAVTLNPGDEPRLLRVEGRPHEASRWTLRDLDPAPGYRAAIAVEGSGWTLRSFLYDHGG
jgi:4'-phosphopantetheinyl transferase